MSDPHPARPAELGAEGAGGKLRGAAREGAAREGAARATEPPATPAGARGWVDRGRQLRARLIASPGFRRFALRFPATRWIARRRARSLFDLCAGFVYSQVLLACVELRLLELLAEGSLAPGPIAERLRLAPEPTLRLLRAAVSLGLLERRPGGRFGLGALGASLVGNPGVQAMVEHHRVLYRDLADPVALLRGEPGGTDLARYWPYATGAGGALSDGQVAAYSALMSASVALVAEPVLDAYPLGDHRCLLDVGGGDGTFLAAVAARAPRLQLVLFDLPAVAERARARLADGPARGRVTVVGGDFFRDSLPVGADVVSLVRVVHDHDDEAALALLRAVRRALPPGGVLLLAEPMAETAGAEPVGDAYFGFYLLAMGSGRARTPAELESLLRAAGFGELRWPRTGLPLQTRLVVARVPAT